MKTYFSEYHDVSINYIRNKDSVDYLIVPKPFMSFYNKNNLPIIEAPARLFMEMISKKMTYIDNYFSE
ncbi:conserved hypothetical protein [Dellaglioa algida]|nr:conserved hypothetical protein [Dellaglioa algida]